MKTTAPSLERSLNQMSHEVYRVWRAQMDRALRRANELQDVLSGATTRGYLTDDSIWTGPPDNPGTITRYGVRCDKAALFQQWRWHQQWVTEGDFQACNRGYDPGLFGKAKR